MSLLPRSRDRARLARRGVAADYYDWVVIGSGFGGSVSALRLAEKGYRVALVEAGERFTDDTLPRSSWDLRKYIWSPRLGLRGILRQTIFKDVAVVSGAGVGGGSLVYAATLYRPNARFYANPQWSELGIDWEQELAPHFDESEWMLGVVRYDQEDAAAKVLREVGVRMGVAESFVRASVGLFLGEAGLTVPDPYFGGEGPARTGCVRCSECHLGCRVGAKNTLEKNYLWFARKLGVDVLPRTMAVDIKPLGAADGSGGIQRQDGAGGGVAGQGFGDAARRRRGGRGGCARNERVACSCARARLAAAAQFPAGGASADELRGSLRRDCAAGH
ncbi:MAG: GMC family oxidoreductase N-terminal domain-containing protein [Solirubrobacteraceae bacterium]